MSPTHQIALPFGGAQTNVNHLNPCRDRRPRLSVRTIFRWRTNKRSLTNLGRGGAMFAKQTCHGAKRSMLASSRVMFAQPFGGEEMNGFSVSR